MTWTDPLGFSTVTAAAPVFDGRDVGGRMTVNGSRSRITAVGSDGMSVTLGRWRWYHSLRAFPHWAWHAISRRSRRIWWAILDRFDKESP